MVCGLWSLRVWISTLLSCRRSVFCSNLAMRSPTVEIEIEIEVRRV